MSRWSLSIWPMLLVQATKNAAKTVSRTFFHAVASSIIGLTELFVDGSKCNRISISKISASTSTLACLPRLPIF
jgi:hypothetical protein